MKSFRLWRVDIWEFWGFSSSDSYSFLSMVSIATITKFLQTTSLGVDAISSQGQVTVVAGATLTVYTL